MNGVWHSMENTYKGTTITVYLVKDVGVPVALSGQVNVLQETLSVWARRRLFN